MNELQHHGVKGMKWGVRRFQTATGVLTAAGKKRYSSNQEDNTPAHKDYKKAHSGKSVKQMSDNELRETINRLNMEKQYSQLTSKEKSAGSKFVKNVLITAGTQVALGYTTKYMKVGVEAVGKAASKLR